MDLVLKPYRVATSKPAQKTYLNTILFLISSAILLGLAIVAYVLFYLNYVPQIGIERVIHLQYGDGPHPYGITSLDSSLISQQAYDISLTLHVPRSPSNLETGNFMLALTLLSPNHNPTAQETTSPLPLQPDTILYTSRRPTLLPYTSPLISLATRLLSLPLYILSLKSESEHLSIPMGELITFPKGWKNIPAYALLEVQAGQGIQVYDVGVVFTAQFGGMRWLMYQHWILSFIGFTGVFWGVEVLLAGVAWLVIQSWFGQDEVQEKGVVKMENGAHEKIKEEETDEEPDLSDTPRTFPTAWRQTPLRYEPKVKDEEEYVLDDTEIQPLGAQADDEDEYEYEEEEEEYEEEEGDGDARGRDIDSGIGTSFSEGVERDGVTRRRSKGGQAI